MSAMVELKGQLSNHLTREHLDVLVEIMDHDWRSGEIARLAFHPPTRPHIRERVDVGKLVQSYLDGRMIMELAQQYAISQSSVKRLLRARGARRRLDSLPKNVRHGTVRREGLA